MSYEKYTDSLDMMDALVTRSANKTLVYSNTMLDDDTELTAIHADWDELYEYVYDNFKTPESRRKQGDTGKVTVTPEIEKELASMREMFKLNREEIEEQLHEIPPQILEQCFPVWMARYMLAFGRVPVMPMHLTTWNKFHNYYGYMVIYGH